MKLFNNGKYYSMKTSGDKQIIDIKKCLSGNVNKVILRGENLAWVEGKDWETIR